MDITPTQESFSTNTTPNTNPSISKECAPTAKASTAAQSTLNGSLPRNEANTPNTTSQQTASVPKVTSNTALTQTTKTTKPKSLSLQGEILKGIQTLDNGLKLTAPPLGGFHTPQLRDSVWNNIPVDIQARWSQKPGAKAWARLFRARYEENAQVMVSKIRNMITQLISAPRADNLLISPPTAKLLPSYICTIENLTFQDCDRSNLCITELVKMTLLNSPAVSEFINKHIITPDNSAVKRALDSIRVTSLNIATSKTSSFTVWNVYCDEPPRFSLEDYFVWSSIIRSLCFPSDDYGTGVPRLQEKQFMCLRCKSLDHPTGLCPLPNTPGWLGPSNVAPKEDLSMTTLDTLSPGKNNSSKHPNSRGGNNRG
ncbi:hypothetical protein F4604DRAFT_1691065 [Suillus subluteus]|nr:hypothetical protein F4604DRAFT_1691065 [Suillus subluteus]